jgi:malonyl-CoA O-methyltransferase
MDLSSSSSAFLPKKRIAARFGRAVDTYELSANVQMEIVKRIADLVKGEVGEGELWCDLGSGSGALLEYLREPPARTRFACLDLAFAPLRRALVSRRTALAVNGDIDFLPVLPGALHGATAVSALQWSESPEGALRGIARALRPSGQLIFSIFVNGSFTELVELRSRMGLPAAVWLPTVSELLMALDGAGFDVSVEDIENFDRTQRFPDALSALGSLSNIGVTAHGGRLLNRKELDELCRNYTLTFFKNGSVPLTYRAVIGKVRKRAE